MIAKLIPRLCTVSLSLLLVTPSQAHDVGAVSDMVEKAVKSVVSISTNKVAPHSSDHPPQFKEFFDRFKKSENSPASKQSEASSRKGGSQGTGFFIDTSGLVVTNSHIVANADKIAIKLTDGTELEAEIVGEDARTDIAVLRIKSAKTLTALAFGDSSKVRLAEPVFAIGNPFGLGASVSSGIVSALDRTTGQSNYTKFIQTDASINRGNAGGPLLNLAGEVIGLNTSILSPSGGSIGVGFAIPSNVVSTIAAKLVDHGQVERGWLGVQIQAVTKDLAEALKLDDTSGALIVRSVEGSPAEKAGLKAEDVVIEVNGKKIPAPRDLSRAIADLPVGERATVVVLRNAKRKTISVLLGKLPTATVKKPDNAPKEEKSISQKNGDRAPHSSVKELEKLD